MYFRDATFTNANNRLATTKIENAAVLVNPHQPQAAQFLIDPKSFDNQLESYISRTRLHYLGYFATEVCR